MKNELMTKAGRFISDTQYQLKKHSPEILVAAGIVGTVIGTVMACKATLKVQEKLKERQNALLQMDQLIEDPNTTEEEYSKEDYENDLKIINVQTTVSVVKEYAPAVGIIGMSIFSIIAGHKILKGRNVAIAAAYAAVDTSFKKYRKNVIEKFGEEVDKELRYSVKKQEIEVTGKDGKTKKKTIEVIDGSDIAHSEYARFFDNGNDGWEKDAEYNLMFLRRQQDYANEMLKARGHLFLNEVYDLLDIPRSKAGQVVGWIYNEKNPIGDNYVDFNIYDIKDESKRRFVNGYERSILLDFNVDGVIYNKL